MGAKLSASSCLFSNRYHFIIGQELEYIIWLFDTFILNCNYEIFGMTLYFIS